jgi:hypothetical protein
MPSKSRWTLIPRKWFGARSKVVQQCEKDNNSISRVPPPTATTTTRTILSTSTIPRISTSKNKIKVMPVSISNDVNKNNKTVTQLQLPAFCIRRQRTSTLLTSSTAFYRQNTFHPVHTEPTIRKTTRINDELSIDTTRLNIQSMPTSIYETSKYENFEENSPIKEMDMSISNMSRCCLIDYPKHTPNLNEECSSPTRSSSPSTIDDNDNSSSSGIFTDERQHTESKDTLSTLEVLSIESIADSQTSLNHSQTRPIIHHYRRPMSVFETVDDQPEQRQTSVIQSHRSHSAEETPRDNQIITTPKTRQSSAAIMKKIEKRFPTNRPPSGTLEKAGFVRVTHDTYRLTVKQINQLSQPRKNSIHLYEPYSNYDDTLRSANDEECYATFPRTSSTEQLNNNYQQNDLRIIVDECIRPMVSSIGKNHLTKNHRYKRSQQTHTPLNIENITDKLLSSIDYSIYARYQRCN